MKTKKNLLATAERSKSKFLQYCSFQGVKFITFTELSKTVTFNAICIKKCIMRSQIFHIKLVLIKITYT